MKKEDFYVMAFCTVEHKVTAHKVYWEAQLQGLRIRYYAHILCGKCQWGLIGAYTQAGIFHSYVSQ